MGGSVVGLGPSVGISMVVVVGATEDTGVLGTSVGVSEALDDLSMVGTAVGVGLSDGINVGLVVVFESCSSTKFKLGEEEGCRIGSFLAVELSVASSAITTICTGVLAGAIVTSLFVAGEGAKALSFILSWS